MYDIFLDTHSLSSETFALMPEALDRQKLLLVLPNGVYVCQIMRRLERKLFVDFQLFGMGHICIEGGGILCAMTHVSTHYITHWNESGAGLPLPFDAMHFLPLFSLVSHLWTGHTVFAAISTDFFFAAKAIPSLCGSGPLSFWYTHIALLCVCTSTQTLPHREIGRRPPTLKRRPYCGRIVSGSRSAFVP